jgi:hypothetical protein
MDRRQGTLQTWRPQWHALLHGAWDKILDSAAELTTAVFRQPVVAYMHAVEIQEAVKDLCPVMSTLQNSWSNNFVAKLGYKRKAEVALEISTRLVEAVVVLHGTDTEAAYTSAYEMVRPRIRHGKLTKEDGLVLRKVFQKLDKEDLTLEQLEANFLAQNPTYSATERQKREPIVPVERTAIARLLGTLPDGVTADEEVQEQVRKRFKACVEKIGEDVAEAGHGDLTSMQLDSLVMVGVLHQYYEKEF